MRTNSLAKILLSVCLLGAAGAASAQEVERGRQTGIHFASHGGIRDWHAPNEREIYIMDRMGRWYHATMRGRCKDLPFSGAIHFDTDALGTFDASSLIRTQYGSCQVESLVHSGRPAAKGGKVRR